MSPDWIVPDWPAPPNVRALVTTRHGGVSTGPYASFNLGTHVGDAPLAVARNRAILRECLPEEPVWLNQVHGIEVVDAVAPPREACGDASVASTRSVVCAVLTADCLPVLFCDDAGQTIAAAHAGWRGLAGGVLEATVARMGVSPERLLVWLGPAIGPDAFEVGPEVRDVFLRRNPRAAMAFKPAPTSGKLLGDLFALARLLLSDCGVTRVYGGGVCTYTDPERYFSYRRDGVTGRFASLVWRSA